MRKAALFCILLLAACGNEETSATSEAVSCAASKDGAVIASNAWLREQNDESGMSAAYFTLCNGTMSSVTLTGVSTDLAGYAEFHETTKDERGVTSMAPTGELTVGPGETLVFEPGGKHVMLMELKAPVAADETAPLVLQFEDGREVTAAMVARSAVEAATDAPER